MIKYLPYFIIFSVVFLGGCSDFIVKDIEDESVKIMAPPDSFHSSSSQVTLWWDEVDGAEDYNVQIVSPSFDYITYLIIDSTTDKNKFIISLVPGEYQWRVRAENNGGETEYVVQTFFIDSTNDLSSVTVNLLSPVDNFFTNEDAIIFQWEMVIGADEYRFQIVDNDDGSIVYDITTSIDTLHYILPEGVYTWKVRAQNAFSSSLFSERTLTVDLTAPTAPTLLTPANGDTLNSPYTLTWTADTFSSYDSVYIYSDSELTAPVIQTKMESTSFNFTTGVVGNDYFWRVKSFDAAGNESPFSVLNIFMYGQ